MATALARANNFGRDYLYLEQSGGTDAYHAHSRSYRITRGWPTWACSEAESCPGGNVTAPVRPIFGPPVDSPEPGHQSIKRSVVIPIRSPDAYFGYFECIPVSYKRSYCLHAGRKFLGGCMHGTCFAAPFMSLRAQRPSSLLPT
ncbi:hypothetical protein V2G26_017477 [Clonostachys chloroleuca]